MTPSMLPDGDGVQRVCLARIMAGVTASPHPGRPATNPILDLGIPERPVEALLLTFFQAPTPCGRARDHRRGRHAQDRGPPDGAVGTVAEGTGEQVHFMNSSVEALATSFRACQDYGTSIQGCTTEEAELACVDRLEDDLSAVDAAALESEECWWAMVVEQARDGLL